MTGKVKIWAIRIFWERSLNRNRKEKPLVITQTVVVSVKNDTEGSGEAIPKRRHPVTKVKRRPLLRLPVWGIPPRWY
jgi:hypothetical protein